MDIERILQKVPLFIGLESKSLSMLIPLFEEESHPAKIKILREGELGDSMYIIVDGQVNITKLNEDNKEIHITFLGSGSYFGEVSLIDHQPRSANVIAETDTAVLRLKKSVFEKLLLDDKIFAINFYRNCLNETLSRMRNTATNLTSSKTVLDQKSSQLDQINVELSNAKIIQDYFVGHDQLASACFKKHDIRQSHVYQPYLEVGGDFLTLRNFSENKVGFMIADVMGHGISAALATGVLRSGFTIFSKQYGENPIELMNHMNGHIYEIFTSLFATAYYALVDMNESKVTISKGGHMHPLVWKNSKRGLLSIDLPGPGLGIIPKAQFHELNIEIEKGDKMLFYTDGIAEQRNFEGEMFTDERLEEMFVKYCKLKDDQIVQTIYSDFKEFCNSNELQDDVTLFLLEF